MRVFKKLLGKFLWQILKLKKEINAAPHLSKYKITNFKIGGLTVELFLLIILLFHSIDYLSGFQV